MTLSLHAMGLAAVNMAAQYLPDLIVMDIRLPKLDGLQATAEIKKDHRTKMIPILAATVNAMPGDREKCLAAGCDGYIAKPFTHRQLGAAIEGLLSKRVEADLVIQGRKA
jgi:two-component system cell cycle response regulator DivK